MFLRRNPNPIDQQNNQAKVSVKQQLSQAQAFFSNAATNLVAAAGDFFDDMHGCCPHDENSRRTP